MPKKTVSATAHHFRVRRDGTLVQLVDDLPRERPSPINPILYDIEGGEPLTNAQRHAIAALERALTRHYYPDKKSDDVPKMIVRPKPIAPGAYVARLRFSDNELWELDAVEYMSMERDAHVWNEKRLRAQIDATEAKAKDARTTGNRNANAKRKATNEVRNSKIISDAKRLVAAMTNDYMPRHEWSALLKEFAIEGGAFSMPIIKDALARKYDLKTKQIGNILAAAEIQ